MGSNTDQFWTTNDDFMGDMGPVPPDNRYGQTEMFSQIDLENLLDQTANYDIIDFQPYLGTYCPIDIHN